MSIKNAYLTIRARGATIAGTKESTYIRFAPRFVPAHHALRLAREAIAAGKKFYGPPSLSGAWNPETKDGYRWCENIRAAGLREVGEAHKLIRLGHKGWYCDAHQDEVFIGAVFQLPARDGAAVYLAGYLDPCNEGAAFLSMETFYGTRGESRSYEGRDDDAAREAARRADSIAEEYAEQAREHDQAWQAGGRWRDLGEEMAALRAQVREVIRAARGLTLPDAACKALRDSLRDKLAELEEARQTRARLADGDGESADDYHTRFYSGDKALCEAFNEGADARVLA